MDALHGEFSNWLAVPFHNDWFTLFDRKPGSDLGIGFGGEENAAGARLFRIGLRYALASKIVIE